MPLDAGLDQGIDAGIDQQDQMSPDESETSAFPPLPSHLLSVAAWGRELRGHIFDRPLEAQDGEVVDPSLMTTLPDSDVYQALREALSAYTVWQPALRTLPPLVLVPGQSVYPLPADFADPVEKTWGSLLAPDGILSGRFPGSRYALLRQAAFRDGPLPQNARGTGFGYGQHWAGNLWDGSLPLAQEDAQGNVVGYDGLHSGQRAAIYPASFDAPTPVFVLSPPPAQARTLVGLTYRAAHLPRRLVLDTDTNQWATDMDGRVRFVLAPLGQDFALDTDVLPFSVNDYEAIRLLYRYATAWTLMQKILPLSETDGVRYAFFEERSGLGRGAIQTIADRALREFNERTKNVPHGGRY